REGAEAFKKNTRVSWVDQYYLEERKPPEDSKKSRWTEDESPTRRAQSGRGYSAPGSRPRRDSHIRTTTPPRRRGRRDVSPSRRTHAGRRSTPDRRDGQHSPRRFLYTPPEGGRDRRFPLRTRSSADIFVPRSKGSNGRKAWTPSPAVNGRDPYSATLSGGTRWTNAGSSAGRLSPSLPYTAGKRTPQRRGRVSSAPKYGRSMSHPRGPIVRMRARSAGASRADEGTVLLQPALHGKTKRTAKQRAVKGGSKKTPHSRPTPWKPVGDPTLRHYRTRPDNYSSGTSIAN
ncbi:hypothetical protein PMAYCL1PPCAC_03344, partial [Pristionchus mayeri]